MILHLNAEVGGLSVRLFRLKKKKEKKIKIQQKLTENNNNKFFIAKLGFEPRSLAWKAKIIATGVLFHMASLQIYKIFVQISVHRMGDQQ